VINSVYLCYILPTLMHAKILFIFVYRINLPFTHIPQTHDRIDNLVDLRAPRIPLNQQPARQVQGSDRGQVQIQLKPPPAIAITENSPTQVKHRPLQEANLIRKHRKTHRQKKTRKVNRKTLALSPMA
jgi:hypothetical protein